MEQTETNVLKGLYFSDDVITEKALRFGITVINLHRHLTLRKKEFVLSAQLLRSGTSIGANRTEAIYAQSDKDFLHKNKIALSECAESLYWITLLKATDYITAKEYQSLFPDCEELVRLLTSTVKTLKNKKAASKQKAIEAPKS